MYVFTRYFFTKVSTVSPLGPMPGSGLRQAVIAKAIMQIKMKILFMVM